VLTVYSDRHRLRDPKTELSGGQLVPAFECPARAEVVHARVLETGLGEVVEPKSFGPGPIARLHDPAYLEFLETAWEAWRDDGHPGEAIPAVWPARGMRQVPPADISGRLGYYALAAETSITEGTYAAARLAVDVALTAQDHVAAGARAAFALCRPPGHHAAADLYGGYCFLNNAAVAAQRFLDRGAQRVCVLDVDFHHGNGTQALFHDRSDVLFLSIHGDPAHAFPHFTGYADETGAGAGEGFTGNYPLPPGTAYPAWSDALEDACRRIQGYAPDALVVSLGVDTFRGDPISFFRLESEDFRRYGGVLGKLGLPTLFVMEGGYAVEAIGRNAVNVLQGFEEA